MKITLLATYTGAFYFLLGQGDYSISQLVISSAFLTVLCVPFIGMVFKKV
jgi:hypothetical protein